MSDTTLGNWFSGLDYNIMKLAVYANHYRQQDKYATQFHGSTSYFQSTGR
jgi:hypothetical protein